VAHRPPTAADAAAKKEAKPFKSVGNTGPSAVKSIGGGASGKDTARLEA